MGDMIIFYFLQNIFIFCLIFWGLTWGAEYFFTKKNHVAKKQLYECGFRSLTELNIQINLNFSMMCVFLVLYDIEFTLLFPVLFNIVNIYLLNFFVLSFFFFIIIYSLYYDWQFNTLNWQY
jgi:NADH-quinone oxidoreductase subunit A